ncbi:hypothetical protein LSTR_LSTR010300 [Laodelphax striatellus]|uniref:Uncharacterized protein n=1 Tax=Laodelphax striatellus TaxID=195883 RepID=A0A482XRZ9_LAOST|nr:hypothetical protein LSTR_LSTR010300 [Laodelphax striatellus]
MLGSGFSAAESSGVRFAFLVFVVSTQLTSASDRSSDDIDGKDVHRPTTDKLQYDESLKKILSHKCLSDYSMTCWKLDLVGLIDSLRATDSFQVVPGVTVVRDNSSPSQSDVKGGVPPQLADDVLKGGQNSSYKLDALIIDKVDRLIRSVKFKVHLEDSQVLKNLKDTAAQIIDNLTSNTNSRSGRSKKGVILWSSGMLAALGFAAMAAVTGKALMAALLALAVSAFTAIRGSSSAAASPAGYKAAHYEIIAKPVHYAAPPVSVPASAPAHYYDHDHLHSTSYAPGYDYARQLESNGKATNNEEYFVKDGETFRPSQIDYQVQS